MIDDFIFLLKCSFTDSRCVIREFNVDTKNLAENEEKSIKRIVEVLNDYVESANMLIIGHTDSIVFDAYNDKLGINRSRSILELLKKNGLNYYFTNYI